MEVKLVGNKLTITCEIGQGVPSSSGKSLVVASTNGFAAVTGSDLKISLNVIRPLAARAPMMTDLG